MFKKGEADHSLLVMAAVVVIAIGGLVIFFNQQGALGAANIILPPAPTTVQAGQYVPPDLIGDKVKIQAAPVSFVEQSGKQAAYDSYVWCRDAQNWESYKEKSQCCNMRCATECSMVYNPDPYARDWQEQDQYDMCKETWCEDMCRAYLWQEYQQ